MKDHGEPIKRRTVLAITLSLGIVILIFAGFHALPDSHDRTASANGSLRIKTAPDFELKSLEGQSVKLSEFRGKIVVLNFWATWCAPCRVEMPTLLDLYNKYRSKGVEFIGVAMDDGSQERVGSFVKKMGVNYTILLGNQSVAGAYGGLRLLPQTVFITQDGQALQTIIGMDDRKDLEASIEQLLLAKSKN